jgi:hypothetical protein
LRHPLRHGTIHRHFGKQENPMKKTFAFLAATLFATAALAYSCRYYTVTVNGKTLNCSECCYGSGSLRRCDVTCN